MTWRGDTDVYRENLRAQAEAFMPASSNHFAILFLAKILRTKTRYDFRFLACHEIIDNILIVSEFRPYIILF